jgi:MoaA/NifB/PqqE/SkfB family radical SAM enzyme
MMNLIQERSTYLDHREKLRHHMARVMHLKEFGYSYPSHLTLGLVTYCDQFCRGCYAGGYRFDPKIVFTASLDVLRNALGTAVRFGHQYEREGHLYYFQRTLGLKAVTLVGSGEPLLYPHLKELVLYMRKLGLDIGIYTNGNSLCDGVIRPDIDTEPQDIAALVLENFRFVRVSLDAASPETHLKERGVRGQFHHIIDNLRNMVERRNGAGKAEPTIGIQFTIDDFNAHEIIEVAKLTKALGVDYLAYKPKYVPWHMRKERMTQMQFEDVETQLLEAQSFADEKFAVHGKFQQFKLAWGANRTNTGECYTKCTDVWFSSYLDVDIYNSPARDAANMRIFICVNKDKEERDEHGELQWSIGPITPATDFEQFWLTKMPNLVKRINVLQCVAGCRDDPYNRLLAEYLPKNMEELCTLVKDSNEAPPHIHVNHI